MAAGHHTLVTGGGLLTLACVAPVPSTVGRSQGPETTRPDWRSLCTHILHPHRPESRMNTGFQELGWLMGLEPTTTGITILDSTN
jgi:hypothetical protein